MRKRLRIALFAGPIAALAFMAFSASAVAGNGDSEPNYEDPQTANIPYLAWAGNQVRLAKCLGRREMESDLRIAPSLVSSLLTPGLVLRAKFRLEDWSGTEPNATGPGYRSTASIEPQFLNDSDGDTVAYISEGRLCFSVTVSSLKPGLAVIKGAARIDLAGLTPGFDILGKHQFVVIWMRSQAPVIREVANADFPSLDLGDPLGDGIFNPLFKNGLVEVTVGGNFPLGNDFAGIDADNVVNLPADWPWLASKFAVDDYAPDGGVPGRASMRWDIHDDQTPASNHAGDNSCTPQAGTVDAVDNCILIAGGGTPSTADDVYGDELGPFSHYFGNSTFTAGPFDPLRADETFLADNALNADDAPMPALRVDVRIAAGGIGSLEKADKDDIYVRDRTKPDNAAHNLYAPYYVSWIPAAGPAVLHSDRSGVAGHFLSNNFPGYQNSGPYDFYDLAGAWEEDPTRSDPRIICRDELGVPRPNIEGDDHVAVYTDEHGKAFVTYNPNTGFRFMADSNGRCDLSPGPLGTAAITAEGIYPDQPVLWDQLSKASNTLTKTVNSLARKTLSCVPKGFNESFCVETILDIQGRPVSGALVRFSRTPLGNIEPDAALHGGFDTRGQILVEDNGPLWVDVRTNAKGQAGVVVTESLNICVDVKTENMGTRMSDQNPGVKRFFLVNPTTGGTTTCGTATGGSPGGNPGGTPPGSGSTGSPGGQSTGGSASSGTTASVVSLAGNPVPAAKSPVVTAKPAVAAKVVSASLLVQKGNRYLQLRVKSPLAKAKVRIVLIGKNGKVNRVVLRTIATNRMVLVPGLKLGKSIKSVRVSVA